MSIQNSWCSRYKYGAEKRKPCKNKLASLHVPYPRESGPMGGAPYIGPRLGDGSIFEVSILHLYAKECPGKLLTLAS